MKMTLLFPTLRILKNALRYRMSTDHYKLLADCEIRRQNGKATARWGSGKEEFDPAECTAFEKAKCKNISGGQGQRFWILLCRCRER